MKTLRVVAACGLLAGAMSAQAQTTTDASCFSSTSYISGVYVLLLNLDCPRDFIAVTDMVVYRVPDYFVDPFSINDLNLTFGPADR